MKLIHFIKFLASISLSFVLSTSALAADSTKLSEPIGAGILPGSANLGGDIRTSALFSTLIPYAIKYLVGLGAVLSVIAIMVGGYQYLTAYGNDEGHKKAIKTLIWAVGGLVICITAYAIVALVSSLQFT